jgi:hypothetical protein
VRCRSRPPWSCPRFPELSRWLGRGCVSRLEPRRQRALVVATVVRESPAYALIKNFLHDAVLQLSIRCALTPRPPVGNEHRSVRRTDRAIPRRQASTRVKTTFWGVTAGRNYSNDGGAGGKSKRAVTDSKPSFSARRMSAARAAAPPDKSTPRGAPTIAVAVRSHDRGRARRHRTRPLSAFAAP